VGSFQPNESWVGVATEPLENAMMVSTTLPERITVADSELLTLGAQRVTTRSRFSVDSDSPKAEQDAG